MPAWNRADVIACSIESVLAQTFIDYELIVVDDGSEDNLQQVVEPYCQEHPVHLISMDHQGASAARNRGLAVARGRFVAYLDSDNIWKPQFLERMYQVLTSKRHSKKTAYCQFDVYEKNRKDNGFSLKETGGRPFNYKKLLQGNYVDMNTFVHARECLHSVDSFDPCLKMLIDWDFILRMTAKFPPLYIKEPLVDYYFGRTDNAITDHENARIAKVITMDKFTKKPRNIQFAHDAIPYSWKNVSPEKYLNWQKMNQPQVNTKSYEAYGFPYMLQIEPTNTCNLACPLCPVTENRLNRESRHLRLDEFKAVVDDMEDYLLLLVLWDWGEPFMNRELPQMIRYAADRDVRTVTSTNAHFLKDSAYVEEILSSGLTNLIVAIDSLHADHYTAYRKKGELGRAVDGLENLLNIKKKMASKTMVNLRMVVMKYNEDEISEMRSLARKLKVDWFTVKTVNPSCGISSLDEEILPENPDLRRYQYKEGTYERVRLDVHCSRVWHMSNIFSDGSVVPCCYDFAAEMKVGNIQEKPFREIWQSQGYSNLRKKIFNEKDSIPKCETCTINYKLANSGWFVEARRCNPNLVDRYHSGRQQLKKVIKKILPKSNAR